MAQHLAEERRRRPGGRSARVRAAVLRATFEELASVGYPALSFEALARRAGVHKTTLYRRWEGKEDLLLDALLEHAGQAVPVPDTGSLRGDLRSLAREIVGNITSPEGEAIVRAISSLQHPEPALREAIDRFWNARFALTGQIVSRAADRGEVPRGTDANDVIESLIAPVYLRLAVTRRPLDDDAVTAIADQAWAAATCPGKASR